MSERKDEGEPGFKVVDRRGRSVEAPSEGSSPRPQGLDSDPSSGDPAFGPLDFTTFVLSLGSSAAVHLGDAADPDSGEHHRSIPQAKQIIDLLGLLREKTTGNLTADEAKFLDGLLYDLRLRFVQASKP